MMKKDWKHLIEKELIGLLGKTKVLAATEDKIAYSYDGTFLSGLPEFVVLPRTTGEVKAVVGLAVKSGMKVVPRGAGTGLSGGAVPGENSIVVDLSTMNKIVEIDRENMLAVVEAGVVTGHFHQTVENIDLFYPPDPGSSAVCTIGGNVAECAGGMRGLKYGVTRDYVMGLEVVLPNSEVLNCGGKTVKNVTGYDLPRLFTGSEGTLGIITKATLKLLPRPKTRQVVLSAFKSLDDASAAVIEVLNSGIIPVALEIMDDVTIHSVEKYLNTGLPLDAAAILLFEVDGRAEEVRNEIAEIETVCNHNGAGFSRVSRNAREREDLWRARKAVSSALVQSKPTKISEDATVPRKEVPNMIRRLKEISAKHRVEIAIFGHAGDGNLHPNILTDQRDAKEMVRVEKAIEEIFQAALDLGGTLSGEHGVGLMKAPFLPWESGETGINLMRSIKQSIDPNDVFNPGKVFGRGQ